MATLRRLVLRCWIDSQDSPVDLIYILNWLLASVADISNHDSVSTIRTLFPGLTYIRHGLPVLSLIPSSNAMVLNTLGTHT